jgi:hypothetical protein
MNEKNLEEMKIEGQPSRRFKLSYGGQFIGSYDTVAELLKESQ